MKARKAQAKSPGKPGPAPGVFRIGLGPTPQVRLAEIAEAVDRGQRKHAAYAAKGLAQANRDNADLLCNVIEVLAKALEDVGDSHRGRGRPKSKLEGNSINGFHPQQARQRLREVRLNMACNTYEWIIVARDILDGRSVSAEDLAGFVWTAAGAFEGCEAPTIDEMCSKMADMIRRSPSEAMEAIEPLAKEELRHFGLLSAPRQGFRSLARRKIAAFYGFSEHQLKRAQ